MGSSDDGAIDVDGVAGVGNEDGVARVENRQAQMGDAFFGADGDDGFGVGIEVDVVARLYQLEMALRSRGIPLETSSGA